MTRSTSSTSGRRARSAYAELVAAGDGWLPGYAVRDPMGRWQFERAHAAIEDAAEVLEVREEIEAAAKDPRRHAAAVTRSGVRGGR